MGFKFESIQGIPGVIKFLKFDLRLDEYWDEDVMFCGLEGQLLYGDNVLSNSVKVQFFNLSSSKIIRLDKSINFIGNIFVSINDEALSFIEEKRNAGDIQLKVKMIYSFQNIIQEVPAKPGENKVFIVGPVQWRESDPYFNIPKSQWINVLNQLKYSEIELFEVNKGSLISDPNLVQAFNYLTNAQKELRNGNYDGVLVDCRASFESAAKYASEGSLKLGYDLLLDKAFKEDKKRTLLNSHINSINDYSHLGRHADYPSVRIDRDEAEFIFISTLNVFSLLSRRLAKYVKGNE